MLCLEGTLDESEVLICSETILPCLMACLRFFSDCHVGLACDLSEQCVASIPAVCRALACLTASLTWGPGWSGGEVQQKACLERLWFFCSCYSAFWSQDLHEP